MITILCSGTRGDVQPYVALAQQLRQRGQPVRIAASQDFEAFVRGYGVDYYPIRVDMESVGVDPEMIRQAQRADNLLRMLATFRKMRDYGIHMVEEFHDACIGSDALVYHPGLAIGRFMADRAGIPSILATPFPLHRTTVRPSVIAYGKVAPGRLATRFSHTVLQHMLWMASKGSLKPFWTSRYGALPPDFGMPFERSDALHPAVVSCSNHVFPRPADWDPHVHQHGYWFVEEPEAYRPSPELEGFLAAGGKPVYIGFGSMFDAEATSRVARQAIEALKLARKRGVLSGIGRLEEPPEDIIAIDGAPHSWLFPRMAGVVHHGGAGTSAAGFRAGVPSIITPFALDQHAWAHRAHELGVGPKPLPAKRFTAARLADAIRAATTGEIIERARELGDAIATENGAHDAATVIADTLG